MTALRIGFLFRRPYGAGHVSIFPKTMQALAYAGVVVDVIAANGRLIDLSTIRVEHDLYVLKQISGISMSLAGVLHAQGAAIVNPYPVTVAIRDKVIAARILGAAGAPMPATYVVSQPDLLTPLLDVGPLVVKPYDGTCGLGVRVVRNEAELFAEPRAAHKPPPILAQRYHPPEGRDLKIYVIGQRLFGVRKIFPARTEAEKYGEPFTPTAEQTDIALRCGRAFGIDLYGVDLIESEGRTYVVDMSSIPGFKGVPDAPSHLANYFYAAAERADRAAAECERQLARFLELTGELPTHVDSHHDVHHDPRILPLVLALARSAGVPVRGHSAARHLAKFYGRWGGATHPEQIGVDGLLRLVDVGVGEGVTELSCHPGYVEPGFRSSYAAERELELRTLCDPRVRQAIRDRAIELIGFRDLLARAPRAAVPQAAP